MLHVRLVSYCIWCICSCSWYTAKWSVRKGGEKLKTLTIFDTYVDKESGRKGKRERTDFARMFDDAAKRKFDVVLFWSLDRFTREGIRKTLNYLQQLDGYGVKFKSYTEPLLDTENELIAHIIIAVISYFAQQEAVKISERTKAGLERVKSQGKTLGRPGKFAYWKPKLIEMKARGYSQGKMTRETGLAYNTVKNYLKKINDETHPELNH